MGNSDISLTTPGRWHQSESSGSNCALIRTFAPSKLRIAWQFGTQYYLL